MAARRNKSTPAARAEREFLSEAEEILERMRDDLALCLESATADEEIAPDVLNRLFRSAHSLKGLSGLFGLGALAELTHRTEDLLDAWRLGRARVTADGLALFEEAVALFGRALEQLAAGALAPGFADAVAQLLARIDAWRSGAPAPQAATGDALDAPPALLRALTEYEEHRLRENLQRGRAIYVITAVLELASFEERLSEIGTALREVGELLSTLPSPGDGNPGEIRFALLAATDLDAATLARRLDLEPSAIHTARAGTRSAAPASPRRAAAQPVAKPSASPAAAPAVGEPDIALADRPGSPREATDADAATLRSISDTVRVDIRKLDELMNLVGELAQERGALAAFARKLAADTHAAKLGAELDKIHKALDRKLQDLQASVIEVRMVPLRQVFDKLSRVARRLKLDLGKNAQLEIKGADTELDKLIVEQLVDPLMHIVRNAFDHALESAQERVAAGKPEHGHVRIEATQRGNDVVISVADDGRGIDTARVRARAIERGLISADAQLTQRDLLDLVFAPGLSTRSEVTETSGRGVGMDVVRANVSALGGIASIDSTLGKGTVVTLTLPITLAIIQALVVGVGGERYAIPLNSVREVLIPEPDALQRSGSRELLALRGEALPVLRLREEFSVTSGAASADKPFAVILGLGDARLALLVDRLEGQRDSVIKPIQGPVRSVRGVAGATELGDQAAVLVLDVAALVSSAVGAGLRSEAA
ncbi:MAG: chemotaxis protein CheA [Deltaproteobacteria bacterium]|nr:chemotaxis protein CheA [Deltaproteobacteria bacterium]